MKPSLGQRALSGREFRKLVDGKLSEEQWQRQVEGALDAFGWWYFHIPPTVLVCPHGTRIYRGIRKGIPDICAIRPPYMIWLELKTERGHVSAEQKRVMDMLRACGLIALHARPRDREQVLQLITHPGDHVKVKVEERKGEG